MRTVHQKAEATVFSPDIQVEDALSEYWLRQVTVRLRREVCWIRHVRGVPSDSPGAILPPFVDKSAESLSMTRYRKEKDNFFRKDSTARYLTAQLEADPLAVAESCPRGSFGWVVVELELEDAAAFVLALALSAVVDNAVGNVIAACLNDPARLRPTLALAQRLWEEPDRITVLADPAHPLFACGLIRTGDFVSNRNSFVDWDSPLKVPAMVANQLLYPSRPLPGAFGPVVVDSGDRHSLTEKATQVAARLKYARREQLNIVPIRGAKGTAYQEVVQALAENAGLDMVEFRGNQSLLEDEHFLNSAATLCWLRGVNLYLGKNTTSAVKGEKQGTKIPFAALQKVPVNLFLGIMDHEELSNIPPHLLLPIIDVKPLTYDQRRAQWRKALGPAAKGLDAAIAECSRRFRYEKETINTIAKGLKGFTGELSQERFIGACRAELEMDLGELAQKVHPRFEDEELILPRKQDMQFKELIKAMQSLTEVHYVWGTAGAWNEGGISVLFAGSPGTGKTMAAEKLASILDLPIYRIDLSQVVNKYIGETEKNLKKVFDAADLSDVILFFDEADSLFGRRTEVKDAHDRYANLEISYLLDRMERFKGLAILATNRKKDLDAAFLRRLRYIIDFPVPGTEQRKAIWRQVIPQAVDASVLDFDFLAEQFQVTGGHIRSIVFNACLQSAGGADELPEGFRGKLTMEQIIIGIQREFDKLNRSLSLDMYGPYAGIAKNLE